MHLAWTSSPLWVIINSLVAFRLTRLLIDDMLPPFPYLRDKLSRWADQRYRTTLWGPDRTLTEDQANQKLTLTGGQHTLAYLITCYWCAGFWISLAVVLAASLTPAAVWAVLALPFALSAVVGLLAHLSRD